MSVKEEVKRSFAQGIYDGLKEPERRAREETWEEAQREIEGTRTECLFLAAGALVDAGVKDDEIIKLMRNYFSLNREDAALCLKRAKNEIYPYYKLRSYMIHIKGYSEQEADNFLDDRFVKTNINNKRFQGLSTEKIYSELAKMNPIRKHRRVE